MVSLCRNHLKEGCTLDSIASQKAGPGAGKVAQCVRALAIKAQGPKLESPASTGKAGCGFAYPCNHRAVWGEARELGIADCQPSSRFSESLKAKGRERQRRTRYVLFGHLHM